MRWMSASNGYSFMLYDDGAVRAVLAIWCYVDVAR
jgi:hypothetical protein